MADVKQETVCFIEGEPPEEPLTNQNTVFNNQSELEQLKNWNFELEKNKEIFITDDELEKFEDTFWKSINQSEQRISHPKIIPFLLIGRISKVSGSTVTLL